MIVTLTLSPGSLPGLAAGLERLGHCPVEAPLLHFRAPESWSELDCAIERLERYPLLALTSPRGALGLARRLQALGRLRLPESLHAWAVGPATAAPLAGFGTLHIPAESQGAEGLAEAMLATAVRGPVLYPCGGEVRTEFAARLRAAGHRVDEVVVYRTVLASPEQTEAVLRNTDLVVIGSHRVLSRASETTSGRRRPALICLGAATARTARSLGWEPAAVAGVPDTAGVLEAVRSLQRPQEAPDPGRPEDQRVNPTQYCDVGSPTA